MLVRSSPWELPVEGEADGTEMLDPLEERALRKRNLATGYRIMGNRGFGEGLAGHISARDPIERDAFWTAPAGLPFDQVRVSDLLLADRAGNVREGDGHVREAICEIHGVCLDAYPDLVSLAHSHSVWGCILASTYQRIDPLTQDSCAFYGSLGLYDDYGGVAASRNSEEAEGIRDSLKPGYKGVILANHGLITAGGSVEESVWWFLSLDKAAQVQVYAEQSGCKKVLPAERASKTASEVGTARAAKLQFLVEAATIRRTHTDIDD